MSDYIKQNGKYCSFNTSEIWVFADEIAIQIKKKIEEKGVPLENWKININRGILTGYNEAFILNKETKDRLIKEDPKSAEIIRPILRGRDMTRYGYSFAQQWLIATFPSRKINIDNYPAIKSYLLNNFGIRRLEQSGKEYVDENGKKIKSRKLTNNKWFETQDSIAYWEDFSKPKIIYPNMKSSFAFYYDKEGYVTNQKCFIITGENLGYLTAFFNSALFNYSFIDAFPRLGKDGRELSKIFFDKIPVMKITNEQNSIFLQLVEEMESRISKGEDTSALESKIDDLIFDMYGLTLEERATVLSESKKSNLYS